MYIINLLCESDQKKYNLVVVQSGKVEVSFVMLYQNMEFFVSRPCTCFLMIFSCTKSSILQMRIHLQWYWILHPSNHYVLIESTPNQIGLSFFPNPPRGRCEFWLLRGGIRKWTRHEFNPFALFSFV